MDRDTRILSHSKGYSPKIESRKPQNSDGRNGDIAVGNIRGGVKLFVKIGNQWHTFSPDRETAIPTYKINSMLIDRTYYANSTSAAELADILGTLISDLERLGLIKLIKFQENNYVSKYKSIKNWSNKEINSR